MKRLLLLMVLASQGLQPATRGEGASGGVMTHAKPAAASPSPPSPIPPPPSATMPGDPPRATILIFSDSEPLHGLSWKSKQLRVKEAPSQGAIYPAAVLEGTFIRPGWNLFWNAEKINVSARGQFSFAVPAVAAYVSVNLIALGPEGNVATQKIKIQFSRWGAIRRISAPRRRLYKGQVGLGVDAGLTYFLPGVFFDYRLFGHLAIGISGVFTQVTQNTFKSTAVGALVSLDVYPGAYMYRGLWIRASGGLIAFSFTDTGESETVLSPTILTTVGWRWLTTSSLTVGASIGGIYLFAKQGQNVTLSLTGFLPLASVDFTYAF